MQNSYQKFAKDVFIIGLANAAVSLSGIIFMPLITKTLGAYEYGIWAQVQVTIGLFIAFTGLGLLAAMARFLPVKTDRAEIQEEFYSVFSLVFLAALVAAAILIAAAGPIAAAFFDGATAVVRITGLIVLVWSLDNVFLALFRAFRQMKRYALFTVATTYAQVGLIAYLVLNGHGIVSIVLAMLAIKAVIFIVLFCLVKSQIGIGRPQFSRIRDYLSFGLPTIPTGMSAWVIASSDRYVIGYFLGAASVGIYSAGYGLGKLMLMPVGVLGFVLPPALSRLYDEDRTEEVRTYLSYSLKYSLALAIPFVFGAAVLAEPVLGVFSTAGIAEAGYLVVPLVALSALLLAAYSPIAQILVLVKKTRISAAIWIICALVNLGLNIVLVPRWGILGAAFTTLLAYGLALGVTSYYCFKEFRFPIDWRFIAKSLVSSVVMSVAIWATAPEGLSATLRTVVTGVAIYGAGLLLLKGFSKEEFRFFKGLFQRS